MDLRSSYKANSHRRSTGASLHAVICIAPGGASSYLSASWNSTACHITLALASLWELPELPIKIHMGLSETTLFVVPSVNSQKMTRTQESKAQWLQDLGRALNAEEKHQTSLNVTEKSQQWTFPAQLCWGLAFGKKLTYQTGVLLNHYYLFNIMIHIKP